MAFGRFSDKPWLSEFLLKSNWDSCYVTEVCKPKLATGEKCTRKHFSLFWFLLWKLEADTTSVSARLWAMRPWLPLALWVHGRGSLFPATPCIGYDPPFIWMLQWIKMENLWWELRCFHWSLIWELHVSTSWWIYLFSVLWKDQCNES